MRIDINTPVAIKTEEKKESKIIKAKSAGQHGDISAALRAEMESDLTKQDSSGSQAQILSFIEEKKKRRGKATSQAMAKYLKIVDALTNPYEGVRGKTINVKV